MGNNEGFIESLLRAFLLSAAVASSKDHTGKADPYKAAGIVYGLSGDLSWNDMMDIHIMTEEQNDRAAFEESIDFEDEALDDLENEELADSEGDKLDELEDEESADLEEEEVNDFEDEVSIPSNYIIKMSILIQAEKEAEEYWERAWSEAKKVQDKENKVEYALAIMNWHFTQVVDILKLHPLPIAAEEYLIKKYYDDFDFEDDFYIALDKAFHDYMDKYNLRPVSVYEASTLLEFHDEKMEEINSDNDLTHEQTKRWKEIYYWKKIVLDDLWKLLPDHSTAAERFKIVAPILLARKTTIQDQQVVWRLLRDKLLSLNESPADILDQLDI